MRTFFCILFLCVVSYLTQRYSCLNVIELPMPVPIDSVFLNAETALQKAQARRKPSSIYLPDYSGDLPQSNLKNSRRIHSIERNVDQDYPLKRFKKTRPPMRASTARFDIRRYFLVSNDGSLKAPNTRAKEYEDEKDGNLKVKISTLVQQTIHDTERKIKSIQHIKEKNREEPPYKAGFILSMIKKSRDVLNELFNVAVKHKDEWKALEQLKIFELIVHTNVDTTNLVRQLVEIHIQHLNATNPSNDGKEVKRRVVLLK